MSFKANVQEPQKVGQTGQAARGRPLFAGDGTPGTGTQAVAQSLAEIVGHQPGSAVVDDPADPFGTRWDTEPVTLCLP
jgi:hypothetical protein